MTDLTGVSGAEQGSAGSVRAVSVVSTGTVRIIPSSCTVSAAEWAALSGPAPEWRGYLPRHIKIPGLKWRDLTYGADIMQRGQVPGVGLRRQLTDVTHKVLALAERFPGLVILPAHDPAAARRLLGS